MRLRPMLTTPWTAFRDQKRCYNIARSTGDTSVTPVASLALTDYSAIGTARFRDMAFLPQKPLVMKAGAMFVQSQMAMPALRKWFDFVPYDKTGHGQKTGKVMSDYLRSFSSTAILPYELAYPQAHRLHGETMHRFIEYLRQQSGLESMTNRAPANSDHDKSLSQATQGVLADLLQAQLPPSSETEDFGHRDYSPIPRSTQRIIHFTAPLALLDAAIKFNLERAHNGVRKLYVAQAPLNDLPKELQDDLPVPRIVQGAGKGDIYDSSIWLGLEPTYTPLHRDPNPNLFIQLCGDKVVRLLPPASGDQIFRDVQYRLGHSFHVNSRLRGPEMMDGPERDLMYKAVWHRDGLGYRQAPAGMVVADQGLSRSKMQETSLKPGDALFIPKGWWHSVTSKDEGGRLNASVNWWFR